MKRGIAILVISMFLCSILLYGCGETAGEAFRSFNFKKTSSISKTTPASRESDSATYGTKENPATLSSPVPDRGAPVTTPGPDVAASDCPACECNKPDEKPSDGPLNCCCRLANTASGALTHMSYRYERTLIAECGACMDDRYCQADPGIEMPTEELPPVQTAESEPTISVGPGLMVMSIPPTTDCCCGITFQTGSQTVTAYETVKRTECTGFSMQGISSQCADVRHCASMCCCQTDPGTDSYEWMSRTACGALCVDLAYDHECGAYPSDPEKALREAAVASADEIGTLTGAKVITTTTPVKTLTTVSSITGK